MQEFLIARRRGPLIDLRFNGAMPAKAGFARASTGAYLTASGALASAAVNVGRFDCDVATGAVKGLLVEPQMTNFVIDNTASAAVAGAPGTLPSGWSVTYSSGLTSLVQTVAIGNERGVSCVDVRYAGTPNATGYCSLRLAGTTAMNCALGDTVTMSAGVKLFAGSLTNLGAQRLTILIRNAGSTIVESGLKALTLSGTMADESVVYTATATDAAYAQPEFRFYVTSGQAIDATFRLWAPQIEKNSRATSPILTSGSAATRAADQLSLTIPTGVSTLRVVFDDGSTQDLAVNAGAYTLPTNLNRRHIARLYSV